METSISRLLVILVGAQGVGGGPFVHKTTSVGQPVVLDCTFTMISILVGSRFGSSGMKVCVISNGPGVNSAIGNDMPTFDVAWMVLSWGIKNSGGHPAPEHSKIIEPLGVVLGGRVNASAENIGSDSHATSTYGGHIWR
jgi:hypothetical protein